MHTPRSSNLLEVLGSIPVEGIGLDELAVLANQLLEARHVVMRDGRAAERIDARTIRFYQTIGIVPKPAYEGRRAIYERDHLVRVVSAKALQAEGYSLAQIQGALPMRKTDELTQALLEHEGGREDRIAADAPRAVAAGRPRGSAPSAQGPAQLAPVQLAPVQLTPFHLAPGVTVLIDPTIVADPNSLAESLAESLALALRSTDAFTMQPRGGEDASIAAAREGRTHKRLNGGIE